jgi:hypothetical protein
LIFDADFRKKAERKDTQQDKGDITPFVKYFREESRQIKRAAKQNAENED